MQNATSARETGAGAEIQTSCVQPALVSAVRSCVLSLWWDHVVPARSPTALKFSPQSCSMVSLAFFFTLRFAEFLQISLTSLWRVVCFEGFHFNTHNLCAASSSNG
ncbi:hypothetical protein GDO78_020413 [Eleutherodactylus coqui]|uniref:Uncharacterized protein n=1 Tax=Eleutherodactylus coqui TaxID=57060 RepID=A0A8J6EQW0_ELECQ|nr:hypothetical protein GDO78_020413 [Eleutherodactylus coqui]